MAQRSYHLVALLVGFALLSPASGRPHNPPQGDEVPTILPVMPPQLGEPDSAAANTYEHSPTHRLALKEGECGAGHTCPGNLCCSQYDYCGSTDDYCGQGCQGGPCKGKGGGCQDGNPALCQSWGTKYCDPKYNYEGRSVAFDLCKKTCNHCSGPAPNPPPRDYHQQMLDLVNQGRRENGRAPLCLNYKLNAAAQAHSQDMFVNKFFSHTGSDGSRAGQRIERQGYNGGGSWAENIAQGNEDATATYNQWKNSPGHWANILGDYKHMGIGKASNYWTQVFGKGASESCMGERFAEDSHGFSQE